MRDRFFTLPLGVKSYDELNTWLLDQCVTYARAHRHPELRDQTIWSMFEAERPYLVPYGGPFDGFHAVSASVSKTCLVRFDNDRYSVSAHAVGRRVQRRQDDDGAARSIDAPSQHRRDRQRELALLGFRLAPRLRDLKDRSLYAFRGLAVPEVLAGMVGDTVDADHVRAHWDEALRLAVPVSAGMPPRPACCAGWPPRVVGAAGEQVVALAVLVEHRLVPADEQAVFDRCMAHNASALRNTLEIIDADAALADPAEA